MAKVGNPEGAFNLLSKRGGKEKKQRFPLIVSLTRHRWGDLSSISEKGKGGGFLIILSKARSPPEKKKGR